MEAENMSLWLMGEDMSHKDFMVEHELTPSNFSESLREKLALFDAEFTKALSDRSISEEEYSSLHAFSTELEVLIRKELNTSKGNAETGAIVALLIGIGAIVGLGKIFKP